MCTCQTNMLPTTQNARARNPPASTGNWGPREEQHDVGFRAQGYSPGLPPSVHVPGVLPKHFPSDSFLQGCHFLPVPQKSRMEGVPKPDAKRPLCALPHLTCLSFLPNLPHTRHLAPPGSLTTVCPWASLTCLGTQSCLHCIRRLTRLPGKPVLF